MWKFAIKEEHFKASENQNEITMYYVCEDFGEYGHTSYESAGLLVGETKEEVVEALALMLIDCSSDPKGVLDKMRAKFTKEDKQQRENNVDD